MALIQEFYKEKYPGVKSRILMNICSCDICFVEYEQRACVTRERRAGKLANGRDICVDCMKKIQAKHIAEVGTKSLKSRTKEQILKDASRGGIASSKSDKPNSSKFSTERWNSMSKEDQYLQVTRASNALQEKLQDPEYAKSHFLKIYAQSQVGYMSKGHSDLHKIIEEYGFESHVQIGGMQVDECNKELKIVIEYNGDMWHCNPRTWKADEYNSAIKMTAGEKWKKDIARIVSLRKMGYDVIIVWESEWKRNPKKYIERIKEKYYEIAKKDIDSDPDLL